MLSLDLSSKIFNRTQTIVALLEDKKAEDVICIDVSSKNYICKFVVIATALVGRHTYALLDMLKMELKPLGENFLNIDEENEDWIVLDLGDIIIHLFTPNHRKKFNLEEFLQKELS